MATKIILSLFLIFSSASGTEEWKLVSKESALMGTKFCVTLYCPTNKEIDAQKAIDSALQKAISLQKLASTFDAESEISQFNAGTKSVVLSPELAKLIENAWQISQESAGAFDPTLGTLSRLWRKTRSRKCLPTPEELQLAKKNSGIQRTTFCSKTRTLTKLAPLLRVDLGGIGKGYASELIFQSIKAEGFSHLSVSTGGDVRLGDAPPSRPEGWEVAIFWKSPTSPDQILTLKNCAISTSGNLFQRIEINGVNYSHIIDPVTGLGITSSRTGSIIASDSASADAWATALIANPALTQIWEKSTLPKAIKAYAFWSPSDNKIISKNWPKTKSSSQKP